MLLITKYAAKGEPRSPMLKQAFNSIVQNVDNNSDPQRAIKNIVIRTLGERDYTAQETMHHLLSPKLHNSSFKVVHVEYVTTQDEDSCTDNSLLDVYDNHQQNDSLQAITNWNFVQFATANKTARKCCLKDISNLLTQC